MKQRSLASAPTAKRGSQVLRSLSSEGRASILRCLASLLQEREADIMAANERDLQEAATLSAPLRSRLSLSPSKLTSLADGLRQLATDVVSQDAVGEVVGRVLVGEGLELARTRVPLGVVLVVFESRPDCLPQVGLFWNPSLPTVGDSVEGCSLAVRMEV